MAGWTSGWVNTDGATAVANGATLNFTHNLGSTDLILSIFLADNQAGANSLFIGNNSEKGSSGTQAYDAQVNNLSPNSLTVQLGSGGYFNLTAAGQTDTGTSISFATKFIKVVAIAAISDPVPGTGDLCKILSEDSGYQMFRNGLTIQWMSSPAFITESSQVVDFPIAFAAKPLKVTASTRYPSDDGSSQQWIQVVTWDATSVTVRAQSQNVGTWTNPVFADIIAIGIAEVTDCPGSTDPNDPSDPEGTKISQLTSATSLKDDDLFVISKENTGDAIYDISQKVTLLELSSELISKIPPSPEKPLIKVTQSLYNTAFGHTDATGWIGGILATTVATNMSTGQEVTSISTPLLGDGCHYPLAQGTHVKVQKSQITECYFDKILAKAITDLSAILTQAQVESLFNDTGDFNEIMKTF